MLGAWNHIHTNTKIGKVDNFDLRSFWKPTQRCKKRAKKPAKVLGAKRQCWTPWQPTPPLFLRPSLRWKSQKKPKNRWQIGERRPDEEDRKEPLHRLLGSHQSPRQCSHSQAFGGNQVNMAKFPQKEDISLKMSKWEMGWKVFHKHLRKKNYLMLKEGERREKLPTKVFLLCLPVLAFPLSAHLKTEHFLNTWN